MSTVSYLSSKQTGNKGEAFVESLFSDYAIVHKIDGSKDVGLDFICEWVNGEKPTQLLFGIQVKTTLQEGKFEYLGRIGPTTNNFLKKFTNAKVKAIKIRPETLEYWKGFNFPVFVFRVIITDDQILAFYKRYTTILHGIDQEDTTLFYLANEENKLLAYIHKDKTWGFCRDLFFDHLRCQHFRGMLSGIDPNDLGLKGWKQDVLYEDVFDNYKDKIKETFEKYKKYY